MKRKKIFLDRESIRFLCKLFQNLVARRELYRLDHNLFETVAYLTPEQIDFLEDLSHWGEDLQIYYEIYDFD